MFEPREYVHELLKSDKELRKAFDMGSEEESKLKSFLETMKGKDRYRRLFVGEAPAFKHMPIDLTDRLANLNFKRVARLMSEFSFFDAYKYSLLASFNCKDTFLPEELLELHAGAHPRAEFPIRGNQLGNDNVNSPKINEVMAPFGEDTEDWSMDFQTYGMLAFNNRFGTPGDPGREFSEALFLQDPAMLAELKKEVGEFAQEPYKRCYEISKLSKAALSKAAPEILKYAQGVPLVREKKYQAIANTCLGCHGGSGPGPDVPFDSPSDFVLSPEGKSMLREIERRVRRDARGEPYQMPPGRPLSDEDRSVFLKHLISP